MNKIIWLDLEGTIISSWQDFLSFSYTCIINEKKIRKFLKMNDIKEVNVFSFAIWNNNDKDVFNIDIKPILENILNIKIIEFPSVEDLMLRDKQTRKMLWNSSGDFCSKTDKFIGFLNYIRFGSNSNHHILIDDTVQDIVTTIKDKCVIETINIRNLQ